MKEKIGAALFSFGLLLSLCSFAAATPIVNGTFQTSIFFGWTVLTGSNGFASIVSAGDSQVAQLGAPATMEQAYEWVDGETLSFDYATGANASPGTPGNAYFAVDDTTGPHDFLQVLENTTDAALQHFSYTFPNSGTGNIQFGSQNDSNEPAGAVAYFDNITSTTHTPEPTSMFLLGTGLVGIAGAIRKRQKQL